MAARLWKPEIGSKVWFVAEHLYNAKGLPHNPQYEFSVYEGEVLGYRVGGWTDVQLRYRSEEGYIELIDIVLSAEKPTIFDNPRDAALLAQEKTRKYMKAWDWVWHMWPDTPPMRQAWEKYLVGGEDHDAGGTAGHH